MTKKPKKNEHIEIGERVTIFKSGKRGVYTADFHYQGHRTRSLRTRNRKLAIQRAKLIDAELINGTFTLQDNKKPKTTPLRKRIDDAITQFIEWHRTEGRRYRTYRRYQGILTEFCGFAGSKRVVHLDDVTLVLVDAYRADRKQSLSERSMHNEGQLIKGFLAWCEEREFVAQNPLYKRRFSRPKPKARKAPSLSEFNAVLELASELRMPQFAFLAFTGARSGECRSVLSVDVDFDDGWIHIRSRPGFETKNGEDRKVPMHPRLRSILEELPKRNCGWFFRSLPSSRYPQGDHHINVKRLNEDFKKLLTRLDLPVGRDEGFTLHSLRRFFRTTAVNSGVPERVVDLWIGHRDTKQMGTIYYDLSDEASQKFMRTVSFDAKSTDNEVD